MGTIMDRAEALIEFNKRMKAKDRKFKSMMAEAKDAARVKHCLHSSQKTLTELALLLDSKCSITENVSTNSILSKKRFRSALTEDEGYTTEDTHNKRIAKKSSCLSKTQVTFSDKTPNNGSLRKLGTVSERMSKSRFKTPGKGMLNRSKYEPITPKTAPNKPLAMMRRPVEGEVAISLRGSPLYVSNISNDKLANVNIPIANGRIISLLPTLMGKLDLADLPKFDADTRQQIKMLTANLNSLNKLVQKSK